MLAHNARYAETFWAWASANAAGAQAGDSDLYGFAPWIWSNCLAWQVGDAHIDSKCRRLATDDAIRSLLLPLICWNARYRHYQHTECGLFPSPMSK